MAKSVYHWQKKREFASKEIEKIKAEILDIDEPDHDFEGFYYCLDEVMKILDKHIEENK